MAQAIIGCSSLARLAQTSSGWPRCLGRRDRFSDSPPPQCWPGPRARWGRDGRWRTEGVPDEREESPRSARKPQREGEPERGWSAAGSRPPLRHWRSLDRRALPLLVRSERSAQGSAKAEAQPVGGRGPAAERGSRSCRRPAEGTQGVRSGFKNMAGLKKFLFNELEGEIIDLLVYTWCIEKSVSKISLSIYFYA